MIEFRLTAAQRRLLEGGGAKLLMGRNVGRRYASEQAIVAQAANAEEAELALEDFRTKGIALQTVDGRRIKPLEGRGGATFQYMRFDQGRP